MTAPASPSRFAPLDPLSLDDDLSTEEIAIRTSVRAMLRDKIQPHVAEWFEAGTPDDPRGLMKEFGAMGLLACTSRVTAVPG